MAPIGAPWVAAEAFSQHLGGARAGRFVEHLAVPEPGLKVPRRGFDHGGWREAFGLHPRQRIRLEVVNQTKPMGTGRPDVDMAAVKVFTPQPQQAT